MIYDEKIFDLITIFNSKARTIHTQRKAELWYDELSKFFNSDELYKIRVAWSHFNVGEGPEELDYECSMLKRKVKGEERISYEEWVLSLKKERLTTRALKKFFPWRYTNNS